jgi:hypothetical protein
MSGSVIGGRSQHQESARSIDYSAHDTLCVKVTSATPVLTKASHNSDVLAQLEEGGIFDAHSIVPSLTGDHDRFVQIMHIQSEEPKFLSGYIDLKDCQLVDPPTNQ